MKTGETFNKLLKEHVTTPSFNNIKVDISSGKKQESNQRNNNFK